MNDATNWARACALIEFSGRDGELHSLTGYLASPDWVVTCAHDVESLGKGAEVDLRFFEGKKRRAVLEAFDTERDCAVLRVTKPLHSVRPLRLADNMPELDAKWWSYGFAAARGKYGTPRDGRVLMPDGLDRYGRPAIHLYSDSVAAGAGGVVQGASGSPVIVDGCVVGHITRISMDLSDIAPDIARLETLHSEHLRDRETRRQAARMLDRIRSRKRPPRAEDGLLFACPVRFVRALLPREVVDQPLADDLRRVLKLQVDHLLEEASVRFDRPLADWSSFTVLAVPMRVALGARPQLTAQQAEAEERGRAIGDVEPARLEDRESSAAHAGSDRRETIPWEALRLKLNRLVLLGDPGYGKSTLLLHEAARRCREALESLAMRPPALAGLTFAVFADAAKLARQLDRRRGATTFVDAIFSCGPSLDDCEAGAIAKIRQSIDDGRCLLVIDALDEVPSELEEDFDEALRGFCGAVDRARLLLSSRTADFRRNPFETISAHAQSLAGAPGAGSRVEKPGAELAELLPFEIGQMETAVRGWFADVKSTAQSVWSHIVQRTHLLSVLRNPLMLRLACLAAADASSRGQPLPAWERQVDLYESFLREAERRLERRRRLSHEQSALFATFAAAVAARLVCADVRRARWEESTAAEAVAEIRARHAALQGVNLGLKELYAAGILIREHQKRTAATVVFSHRTIGEYLTARHLARLADQASSDDTSPMVDRHAWLPEWRPIVLFFVGRLADPLPFVRRLADWKRDDYFRHRLALAARCLSEVLPHLLERDPPLVNEITTASLGLWWRAATMSKGLQHRLADLLLPDLGNSWRSLVQVNGVVERSRAGGTPAEALAEIATERETVPLLEWPALKWSGADWGTRTSLCHLLRLMRSAPAAAPIVRQCEQSLEEPFGSKLNVREAATRIAEIGGLAATPRVINGLTYMLNAPWPASFGAVRAVHAITDSDALRDASPALIASLSDLCVRMLQSNALRQGGPTTQLIAESVTNVARRRAGSDFEMRLADFVGSVFHIAMLGVAVNIVRELQSKSITDAFFNRIALLLNKGAREARDAAITALQRLGGVAPPPDFVHSLLDLLQSSDRDARASAANAFAALPRGTPLGAVGPRLEGLLTGGDEDLQEAAARAAAGLSDMPLTPVMFTALEAMLRTKDRQRLLSVLGALAGIASRAAAGEIIARLVSLLEDEGEDDIGLGAATALSNMGTAAARPNVVAALGRLLETSDCRTRYCASIVVRGIGDEAVTTLLPAIKRLLQQPDDYSQAHAVVMLSGTRGSTLSADVLDRLAVLLNESDARLTATIAWAVTHIGQAAAAPAVVSALVNLLAHEDRDLRDNAEHALRRVAIKQSVTAETVARLCKLLVHRDTAIQQSAVRVIRGMGDIVAAQPFLDRIVSLTAHSRPDVRKAALQILEGLGPAAANEKVIGAVAKHLKKSATAIRVVPILGPEAAAIRVVPALGPAAATQSIVSNLMEHVVSDRPLIHAAAAALQALQLMGVRVFRKQKQWAVVTTRELALKAEGRRTTSRSVKRAPARESTCTRGSTTSARSTTRHVNGPIAIHYNARRCMRLRTHARSPPGSPHSSPLRFSPSSCETIAENNKRQ
jgi:Trypsin-like peptidase domain